MSASDSEREAPVSQFENLETFISTFELVLAQFRATPAVATPEAHQQLSAMLRLSKLTLFYFKETTICLSASAFFAANVMGAAGLESLFLVMCLAQKDAVLRASTWKRFSKGKTGSFLTALGKMNLDKLIELGDEMNWFPKNGIPESFKRNMEQHFGSRITQEMVALLPGVDNLPVIAGSISRESRNYLHPEKCLREEIDLTQTSGITACLFMLLCFSAFAEAESRKHENAVCTSHLLYGNDNPAQSESLNDVGSTDR